MTDQDDNMLSNGDDLVNRVCTLLQNVKKWKWRNTGSLAKELKIDKETLFQVLASHASKPNRRIRYHPNPSGRRMDILWGLVDVVGEDNQLPPLARSDSPRNEVPLNGDRLSHQIFLSHNHRDAPRVLEIAKAINDVDVGCWLYKTHIEFNATIIPKVRKGLEQCCGLIVYVSMHSIGSLWVQKEYGFVLKELNKPTMVVLDGSDVQLIDCFTRKHRYDRVKEYARHTAAILGISSVNERIRIANEVASHVSHFMDRGGVVTLHPVPSQDEKIQFDYGDINNIKQWALKLRVKTSV